MRSWATFTSLEWPPRYPKEMSETTVLVIRSDGGLVFPEQVPSGWARADHLAPDAPLPVRRAVADAIATAATGGSGVARTVLDEATHHELVVVVINAVPLRSSLVTVDELVGRTMDLFVAQTRDGLVAFRVARAPDAPVAFHGDGEKLVWALATLVGNALRALAASERAHTIELRVTYDAEERAMVLSVEDDGPGMPPETARWLFDRDPRTGRAAGLALRLVHDVVAAHGGQIAVRSAPGEGTCVTLRVPRRRQH